MSHDGLCELTTHNPKGPSCGCAGRAWERDPIPAADLPVKVDTEPWEEL
jgi:hypothetical protein